MAENLIDFYSGFEGEGEVRIYGDNTVISIWNGYFDPIMGVLFEIEKAYREDASAFGVVAEYTTCTGWSGITNGKHKINNLDDEIYAFSQFDSSMLERINDHMNDHWKSKIISVHKAILELLKSAHEKNIDVYIEDF